MSEDLYDIVVLAPNQKRNCERLIDNRFRSACEWNITVKCERCGESGHNRITCNNMVPLSQNQLKNKERKMKSTDDTH